MSAAGDLSEGELDILVDGLSDEVAFIYVMTHLGFSTRSTRRPDQLERAR